MDLAAYLDELVSRGVGTSGHHQETAGIEEAKRLCAAISASTNDKSRVTAANAGTAARLDPPEGVGVPDLRSSCFIWDSALEAAASSSSQHPPGEPATSSSSSSRSHGAARQDNPPVVQALYSYAQQASGGDQGLQESLVSSVASALARSEATDDEVSALLAESLGFEQLELVECLIRDRQKIAKLLSEGRPSSPVVAAATGGRSRGPDWDTPHMPSAKGAPQSLYADPERHSSSQKPYTPGSSVVVQTRGEIEEGKRRRAEQRKLQRARGAHTYDGDRDADDTHLSAQEMALLRAQSLQEAAQRPLYTSDRTTTDEPKYPHVYSSGSGGNILNAFGSRFALPPGTVRLDHDFFEEVTIPPPKQLPMRTDERPIAISEMDALARGAFPGYKSLNRLQSAVYPLGYGSNENLLVCAPTGAGKTDVAMLTVLRAIRQHAGTPEAVLGGANGTGKYSANTFGIRHDDFKIIYVAPMKALASEIVGKFSKRLRYLGVKVRELTGDMQMTRQEIAETQMIVTTPEKWDVVTRKPTGEGELAAKVKLLIIDEVHLLHEERGAVIETIVARTLRLVESSQSLIRIVGLSATLPNYVDVADFLRVNRYQGLFFFDSSFRPVPLEQHFLGVKGKVNSPIARQNMDKATFEKLHTLLEQGHQVMIFVHARKETVKTAYGMRDMCRDEGLIDLVTAAREQGKPDLFRKDIMESRNRELKELYETGFGIHHAGMLRKDRNLSERLFETGVTRVLCCTSTLAWGVNLPAYAVLIKGTDIYDASLGRFSDLSILDVLQIFGRAGRPQYESVGVGYIITSHEKLSHYVDAVTSQHPIESKFKTGLIDALNAEVALGSVNSIADGVIWLSYTYLFTRMRRNPLAYGMLADEVADDPQLGAKRLNEIETAAKYLASCKMLEIDESSKQLTVTELGRIAARYYITYKTVEVFNEKLKSEMSEADLLSVFGHATDFQQIIPRENEIPELKKLQERVPCEIANSCDTSAGKANLLLQAYISRQYIEDFALVSDSAYVAQNAGRVMRALFEAALSKRWAITAAALLGLTRAVERRMWPFDHPLAQSNLRADMVHQLSQWADEIEVKVLAHMSVDDIATLCHINARHAEAIRDAARRFPMLRLRHTLRPLLHDLLRIEVTVERDYETDRSDQTRGSAESFYIWIEDEDGKEVLQSKRIVLHPSNNKPLRLSYTIDLPSLDSTAGLCMRWISERWIGSEDAHFMTFEELVMPAPSESHTQLLDLPLLPASNACKVLGSAKEPIASKISTFNAVQTQCFHTLVHSAANVVLAAPSRSGRTLISFLAVWRTLQQQSSKSRTVVLLIYPSLKLARHSFDSFRATSVFTPDIIVKLAKHNVRLAFSDLSASSEVVFTTPRLLDEALRSNAAILKDVKLVVAEDMHLLHPAYELALSLTLRLTAAMDVRWIFTSVSAESVAGLEAWLGSRGCVPFNFALSDRPTALKTTVVPFDLQHSLHLLKAMVKPAYDLMRAPLSKHDTKGIAFVPSRSQCYSTARDFVRHAASDVESVPFIGTRGMVQDLQPYLTSIKDQRLAEALVNGIGVVAEGMAPSDRQLVLALYESGALRVLITSRECCWSLVGLTSNVVIIMGAQMLRIDDEAAIAANIIQERQATGHQSYRTSDARLVDYTLSEILQMQAFAALPKSSGLDTCQCFVLCQSEQAAYLRRMLNIGVIFESELFEAGADSENMMLPWILLREVRDGKARTRREINAILDWTLARQRMDANPSYYGALSSTPHDVSSRLSQLTDGVLSELEAARCIEKVVPEHGRSRPYKAEALITADDCFELTILGEAAAANDAIMAGILVLWRQYAKAPESTAKRLLHLRAVHLFSFEAAPHKANGHGDNLLTTSSKSEAGHDVLDATRSCLPGEVLTRLGIPRLKRKALEQKQPSSACTPPKDARTSETSNDALKTEVSDAGAGSGASNADKNLTAGQQKALLLAVFLTPQSNFRTPNEAADLRPKAHKNGLVKTESDPADTGLGGLPASDISADAFEHSRSYFRHTMFSLVASIVGATLKS